ncbi:MAG TPA: twin-arginine translocation signal domain-containing protein, partial [Longimicrobiales bacterium]
MINRRNFLGLTMSAGAAAVLGPNVIRAFQPRGLTDIAGDGMSRGLAGSGLRGAPIMRAIPSTGETVPAVGLSFSNHAVCGDPAALKEVLRTFV